MVETKEFDGIVPDNAKKCEASGIESTETLSGPISNGEWDQLPSAPIVHGEQGVPDPSGNKYH